MRMLRQMLPVVMALGLAGTANAQEVLTEWVENDPFQEQDKIALGYPVPIPVDTPLPFDGFRTYMGLHTRHQDLAATTPWVHPEEIGATRRGRSIWAYRLGDDDLLTPFGAPEPATLTNGGIHAREWQSPEVVTGILELIATHESDRHFYDFLRENVNMVVIPSLNIDGFLQTQRFPSQNYLQSDIDFPATSPRDGRMRRKNMLQVDEDLLTTNDHLRGVDLNRNNPPYWNSTNGQRSSSDRRSLVHHGTNAQSEPETQALDAAAHLGPIEQLRLYTDVHSFSLVHFWGRNNNPRLGRQTENVLSVFTDHHRAFPAGKWYAFADFNNVPVSTGIGSTDEYFTHTYQVPAWTLEIEPSNGQQFHAPLPGGGADYGGAGENGHDGFILPEAEIARVREELAQSFAAVYYRQAGPPNIQAVRIADQATGAIVFEAEWDTVDATSRQLFSQQLQPLELGREYTIWVSFSKPMRWLTNGEVDVFPGQPANTLDLDAALLIGPTELAATLTGADWGLDEFGAPKGYAQYLTDSLWADFVIDDVADNQDLLDGETEAFLRVTAWDMTRMALDGNPATVADWDNGFWVRYDSNGVENDFGGPDETISLAITDEHSADPFVIEPGIAAAWYDPTHDGEGFVIEVLANDRAVMYWFTYDEEGNQNWYIAIGEVRGNRLIFAELLQFNGGMFGPDYDPDTVSNEVVGSAKFIWSGCDTGTMDWHIGNRRGRQSLVRLSRLMGLDCGPGSEAPIREEARYSGSWYDPSHNGEGYVVEVLVDERVVVYWFSYDPLGVPRWFFGVGAIVDGRLVFDDMLTTRGGIFGDDFDPATVERLPWGTLDLDLSCGGGPATYNSTEDGFGSGVLNVVKLTNLIGLACDD